MKHYVVHRHAQPHCNCRRFVTKHECDHVGGQGPWQASYIVSAVTSRQAEDIVRETAIASDALLVSFPLPMPERPEIVIEVWRDQIRSSPPVGLTSWPERPQMDPMRKVTYK